MGLSPAAVLYDASGNPVAVTLDGTVYKLETLGKLRSVDGTIINPAKEDGNLQTLAGKDFATDARLELVRSILSNIKDTDGIRKIVDPLPVGNNLLGQVKITDGTFTAAVTPANKLRVDTGVSRVGLVSAKLTNESGSENMNVNGSLTPVIFRWSPAADFDVEGIDLTLVVEEPTINFGTTFFGIAGLTNGFLVEVKSNDVISTIVNAKYTRDFFHVSAPGGLDLYVASPDIMKVTISLSGIIFKKAGTYPTDDFVRVTVRDRLSNLNYIVGSFKGTKVSY